MSTHVPSIPRYSCRTADASEPAAKLSEWAGIEYYQLDRGQFSGSFEEQQLGGSRLIRESQNCSVLKQGWMPGDRCTISVLHNTDRLGRYLAHPLALNTFCYLPGNSEIDVKLPPSEIMFLSLDRQAFMAAVAREDQRWLERGMQQAVVVTGSDTGGFQRIASWLLSAPAEQFDHFNVAYWNAVLLDAALETLSSSQEAASSIHPSWSKAYRLVQMSRDFISARPDEPPTVMDLCKALGISRRTLQYCFNEIYGVSPQAYLRLVRLHGARRDLLRAEALGKTVAEVAVHWGFWHLARFAQYYRQHFGELPSTTLKRHAPAPRP